MKYSTAVKLVEKMEAGQTVKIRKSKYGGMSSVAWCMICNVFFDRGYDNLEYTVMNFEDGSNQVMISSGEKCLSAKIILF